MFNTIAKKLNMTLGCIQKGIMARTKVFSSTVPHLYHLSRKGRLKEQYLESKRLRRTW